MTRLLAALCLLAFLPALAAVAATPVEKQKPAKAPPPRIVPQPSSIIAGKGSFTLGPSTVIVYYTANADMQKTVVYLAEKLRAGTGFPLKIVDATAAMPKKDYIFLNYIREEELDLEGYQLEVKPDRIYLEANNDPGFFYASQTLLQLLPADVYKPAPAHTGAWTIPCVTVIDTPRYKWRGMMLDCSRHFHSKEFVKRFIDYLAMHKMNTFHWHLTDDQGWRIEIKKYPQLTTTSAWRVDHEDLHWNSRPPQQPGEETRYGGFYTQDDIREVVKYAEDRYITVIPEIELPAHVTAVLAAFPNFSCTGGPFTVMAGGLWPIKDILCGGNDSVFTFLENVFAEVVPLFPSSIIHIGGDEADKTEWKRCPKCQARIKAEGLKDEAELQSFFIKRVEGILTRLGKRVIGWDEIIEGGLPPRASVMSWRGTEGGIHAARTGHDVVMTPTSNCYLDYYQGVPQYEPLGIGGYLPLEQVYGYEPTPDVLTPQEAQHILGVQGNLWAEYLPDQAQVEYMAFPRIAAIAEAGWTAKNLRSWPSFLERLEMQFDRYKNMGVNLSRTIHTVMVADSFDVAAWRHIVKLSTQAGVGEIRYTLDGTEPGPKSAVYAKPLSVAATTVVRAATFNAVKPVGRITTDTIHVSPFRNVAVTASPDPAPTGARPAALVDQHRASYSTGDQGWCRWQGTDAAVTLDLGKEAPVKSVSARFFHETVRLVFLPPKLEIAASTDGRTFTTVAVLSRTSPEKQPRPFAETYTATLNGVKARYVRVTASGVGPAPAWHKLATQPTWLFMDEITIE
jgi:hexosaminidase